MSRRIFDEVGRQEWWATIKHPCTQIDVATDPNPDDSDDAIELTTETDGPAEIVEPA
jgi:hypothetical protein